MKYSASPAANTKHNLDMSNAIKTVSETSNPVNFTPNQLSRFWKKISKDGENGCWKWLNAKDKDGYGKITIQATDMRAHRLSWIIHRGHIPKNALVLHTCDNPECTNPEHLYDGNNTNNMRDREARNRIQHRKGEDCNFSTLTSELIIKIRAMRSAGSKQLEIANLFGISRPHVSAICSRRVWKHI